VLRKSSLIRRIDGHGKRLLFTSNCIALSCIYRDFQPNDLLFVQPTSIGQNLNLSYIEEYLSHLMPDHFYDDSPDEYIRSEQWRCVWPSHRYMKHVHQQLSSNDDGNDLDYHEETEDMKPVMSGPPEILFFHPKSFALMEPDIQAQFFTYQTNHHVIETHRIPHIKSYTRLYKGSATGKCLCHQIAWTMLTSACLSKGAQGELKPFSICKDCKHIRRVRDIIIAFNRIPLILPMVRVIGNIETSS
jgi:hypothetical protein